MAVIDADAHVLESEATWAYMEGTDRRHKPEVVDKPEGPDRGTPMWLVDGKLQRMRQPPRMSSLIGDPPPDSSAFLADVDARLRHMDQLGTDKQVIYPTLFISPLTANPEVELALARSYNRWLSDIYAQSSGRLPWIAVLPLLSIERAVEELRVAREHGACGAFMRCAEPANRRVDNPYFFPLYEEAQRLDVPICVHSANGSPELTSLFEDDSGFARFKLAGVGAFHALLFTCVPERFPRLRFGFIELSAQWVPYALHDLRRRLRSRGEEPPGEGILRQNRVYVACQTDDDLPYVIRYAGEDNLVIGTDYGHADTSSEILGLQTFQRQSSVSEATRRKILDDNARALYGI